MTNEILQQVKTLPDNQNYWFVRTNGGDHYEYFINGNFIAIGYNQILLSGISRAKKSPNPSKIVSEQVKKVYKDNMRPSHTANQILKFTYDIKKGDIVIIPSKDSQFITFGEVQSTPAYNKEDNKSIDLCSFQKRKSVKWFKTANKHTIHPNLFKLLYSRHAITHANQYEEYIDKLLYSFFIKKGKAHLVLDVQTQKGINGKELFKLGLDLFTCVDTFGGTIPENINSDEVEVKVNLNSPGIIEFIGYGFEAIAGIGLIVTLINGGDFSINLGTKNVKLKSDGIISNISKFLNDRQNRKLKDQLSDHIKNLDIKSPDDIKQLLRELNNDDKPSKE